MKIARYFLILFALVLIAYHDFMLIEKKSEKKPVEFIREVFDDYDNVKFYDKPFPHWEIFKGNNLKGIVFYSRAAGIKVNGYGGPLNLLIAMDKNGKILNVDLRDNYETPAYIAKLHDFFLKFRNIFPDQVQRIDTVAGATISSTAIKKSVYLSARKAGSEVLGIKGRNEKLVSIPWKILIGMLTFFLIMIIFTRRKRIVTEIASILIVGFWLNLPLSIDQIFKFLELNLPDLVSGIGVIIIFLVAVIPSLFGRNIYCKHICPFGAIQRLTAQISPVVISPSVKLKRTGTIIRNVILLLLFFAHFGLNIRGLGEFEPYTTFFTLQLSGAFLLYVIFILLVSFFYPMFWCSYLCPTGAFLDNIKMKSKTKP